MDHVGQTLMDSNVNRMRQYSPAENVSFNLIVFIIFSGICEKAFLMKVHIDIITFHLT